MITLTQEFDFAASHRLHAPALSEAQNRATYGKCNNPCGHGHNYRLSVSMMAGLDAPGCDIHQLETVVDREILARYDHRNLDQTGDFASGISSVEHIAQRCFELLQPALKLAGGTLTSVTVWETDKTSATVVPD